MRGARDSEARSARRRARVWALYRAGLLDAESATRRLLRIDIEEHRATRAGGRAGVAFVGEGCPPRPGEARGRRSVPEPRLEWCAVHDADGADAELWRAAPSSSADDIPAVEIQCGPAYLLVAALERDGWCERAAPHPTERHLRWFSRATSPA